MDPFAPEMFRKTLHWKYFRLLAVVSLGFLMIPSSSSSAVGERRMKGCVEVAIYVKKMAIEGMTIDLRLVSNIIDCIKELHRLYRTNNWKEIHSMIPNAVRDVLHNAQNIGGKALAVATITQSLFLMPLYSLFKAVDMFHQAMTLGIEYKEYEEELERLQVELELTIDQIHNELLPNWEHSSTTALQETSTEVLRKLDRFYADLKQLARNIKSDIDRSLSNRDRAVVSALGSVFLLVTSLGTGNVPGAVFSGVAIITSLVSNAALVEAIHRLESLQHEVETTCNEVKEYRSRLVHEISRTPRAPTSDLTVVVFLVTAFTLSLVYLVLVVSRETAVDRLPTGKTGTGRGLQKGRVGTRQRDKRAPRVRSVPTGIARFRTPRVLRIKYNQWHKIAPNRDTVQFLSIRNKSRTTMTATRIILLRQNSMYLMVPM